MKEFRLGMTEREMEPVLDMLESNKEDKISYKEFMELIIGNVNEFRKLIIETAYKELSKRGDVTVEKLKDEYNAERHPEVMAKNKTEGETLSEFMDTLDQHHLFNVL